MWAGHWDAAEAWARRHVEVAERMGQTAQLRQANFNLALLASYRGESAAARRLAEELLAEAATDGDLWSEASARGLLGLVCGFDGDTAGAASTSGGGTRSTSRSGCSSPAVAG